MNERLFTCFGTVTVLEPRSSLGCLDITIENLNRLDDVAPILIHASGPLANYIRDIHNTDAEERYIQSIWSYDGILQLRSIEIPSTNPHIPAKILVNPERPSSGVRWLPTDRPLIFGSADYIENPHPEPMSREEHRRYFEWLTHLFGSAESEPPQEQEGDESSE